MNLLFSICVGLSFGIIFGAIARGLTKIMCKKTYTEQQIARGKKLWKIGSRLMTYVTFLFLALGLVWCTYFLILGVVHPEQVDYANNMAEMITSVLTVVSITFAFYEFVRRK